MLIIGLTGSIGMGKSAAAEMIRGHGVPVCDADKEVHKLYATGGAAVAAIEAAFPGTTGALGVDRSKLADRLLADAAGFKALERIVHPLVRAAEREFLLAAKAAGHWAAVLEVPLLFETGGDKGVDATIVVSAPPEAQKARVLARTGMSEDKLLAVLSRQWPDARKRQAATFVVDTGGTRQYTGEQIALALERLRSGQFVAAAFERQWR